MASTLLAAIGSLPVIRELSPDDPVTAIRGLLPRDLRTARVLGELYLESQPDERSSSWLTRELFGDSSLLRVDRSDLDRLKRYVSDARARDFERGDLVLLQGWLFARTEARLLALCATVAAP